jgi:hypothetical protein
MKIRLLGDELFHADRRKDDGQTYIHDEANSLFRNFSNAEKNHKKSNPVYLNSGQISETDTSWKKNKKTKLPIT